MMSASAQEWRRYWRIALGCAIGQGCGFPAWPVVAGSFVIPLQNAFGWTRGDMGFAYYFFFVMGISFPLVGRLLDRLGVRQVLMACLAVMGLDYLAMACMNGSLILYYVLFGLLVVSGAATTAVSYARVIGGLFRASRGLAFAASRLGVAAIGAVLPGALYAVIAHFGWRAGFGLMGGLALLVGLPVCYFWVHEKHELRARAERVPRSGQFSWRVMLGDRRVIALCVAGGLAYLPMIGLLGQMQPILIGHGIEPKMAASLVGTVSLSLFVGTVVSGFVVDRLPAQLVAFASTFGAVAGCLLLAFSGDTPLSGGAAVVLFGLAEGAIANVFAVLVVVYFGMEAYATVHGATLLCMSMSAAIGGRLYGAAFDRFGGYREALLISALCYTVSAAAYLFLGRVPERPGLRGASPKSMPTGAEIERAPLPTGQKLAELH